jgi:3-deoxy-manno-octulosonate cytidylyltransferase (CMP-KDO synthetase)
LKTIALLPARLGSTRFPEKMLADLGGKPLIVRSWEAVAATGLFDAVWVVTDHERIQQAVLHAGGKAVMSSPDHPSGSDRLAEIARRFPEYEVIINVQGDEPFTEKSALTALLACFKNEAVQVASVMCPLATTDDLYNPNTVKVTVDAQNRALYFSRAPIPFVRDKQQGELLPGQHFQHIGIYGYRREALLQFTSWPVAPIEDSEKLEQLRLLYNGIPIYMVETQHKPIGIDTAEDLEKARQIWQNQAD